MRKFLKRLLSVVVYLLLTLSVFLAVWGAVRQPTRLNIFVLVSIVLGAALIIYYDFHSRKEKRMDEARKAKDQAHQEQFFEKLEKIPGGKELTDQLRR